MSANMLTIVFLHFVVTRAFIGGWRTASLPYRKLLLGLGIVVVEPLFVCCNDPLQELIGLSFCAPNEGAGVANSSVTLLLLENSRDPSHTYLIHKLKWNFIQNNS